MTSNLVAEMRAWLADAGKKYSCARDGYFHPFETGCAACIIKAALVEIEKRPAVEAVNSALELAILFHDTYERLAPEFGYETRPETRQFSPSSPNGQLMRAVCEELLAALRSSPETPAEPMPNVLCGPFDKELNASVRAVAKIMQEECASDPTFPSRGLANHAALAERIIRAVVPKYTNNLRCGNCGRPYVIDQDGSCCDHPRRAQKTKGEPHVTERVEGCTCEGCYDLDESQSSDTRG